VVAVQVSAAAASSFSRATAVVAAAVRTADDDNLFCQSPIALLGESVDTIYAIRRPPSVCRRPVAVALVACVRRWTKLWLCSVPRRACWRRHRGEYGCSCAACVIIVLLQHPRACSRITQPFLPRVLRCELGRSCGTRPAACGALRLPSAQLVCAV
jgi:hypothetical protein